MIRLPPSPWWRKAWRAAARAWRRAIPPPAERIPGMFPWRRPAPLPFGTVLVAGTPPVVADGKGGVTVVAFASGRKPR